MSPLRVTMHRTFGAVRNSYATALAIAAFLSASAASFAFALADSEGVRVSLASVWAVSVAPLAPVLAALLGMNVWSEELRSGRIALLLSVPVRERDLMLGKYFGVYNLFALSLGLSLVLTLVPLRFFAPSLLATVSTAGFLPAFAALMLQGALWCAMAVAASVMFTSGAAAATCSVFVTVALPRGIWAAFLAWSSDERIHLGEMFLDAHVSDMASGLVPLGVLAGYVALSTLLLFIASKRLASLRFIGRGVRALRMSTGVTVALATVLSALLVTLAMRLELTIDIGPGSVEPRFSDRTRSILADARGDVRVYCFLARGEARFRTTARYLRALKREAMALGGLRFNLCYVDPHWDLGDSDRLVRLGATEGSVVFERGRRRVIVPVAESGFERTVASAILQLMLPSQRRTVYWTCGHGEYSPSSYGPRGLSDLARDLSFDGFRNAEIDLAGDAPIPSDCALVVVAGAKDDFSRVEMRRLDSYLREGGRLLVMLDSAESGGVTTMLPQWEIRPTAVSLVDARFLSPDDVIVSDFSDHAAVSSLRGSRIVLDRPVGFVPSAVAEATSGADRIGFLPLASVGGSCVAAAVERGAGIGQDLSLRPTRLVAIGDSAFVLNAALAANASANRDFFLNCVAYLAGVDSTVAAGVEPGLLVSGLDREGRFRFLLVTAATLPLAVFLLLALSVAGRRRRG